VAGTQLPLKLLAACAGLGEYGRNNICYVPGMGSFLQLAACASDLPAADDSWREPAMMERCQSCTACQRLCPTGAIGEGRFLLHAERCLTFHNERGGPFPGWIDPSWHNALLGCQECQRCCPEDKGVWEWVVEGGSFSEEETALILGGASREELPPATIEHLHELDLLEDLANLPRNLSVLLAEQRPPS
jgi:epoxyqueuosine reductase